jgi:hypothetical protein
MAVKMIKHRLFTWFEEIDSPVHGEVVLTERIAHLGEEPDITNDAYIERGEALDSFYSDEEADAIREGTYDGPDAEAVYAARKQMPASAQQQKMIMPADGEHGGVDDMDAAELGEYISENKLTIPQTLALVPEDADEDTLQKFIDAENIATDNDPRQGVIDPLERRQAEA